MTANGITIIAASAGSGKTFRLTQEVTSALAPDAADPIDVESLVAVTFTRKAHAELEARIRHALARGHAHSEALRIPLAYVGTIHAVSLRLLQEFAIDAGLSPNVDVVAGNETKLLRQAFERTLDDGRRQLLDDLATRLEIGVDHRAHRTDWVAPCADIMDLARANRVAPTDLARMAERSVATLLALLPAPATDGNALDSALARSLDDCQSRLVANDDGRSNTAAAIELVRDARRRLHDNALRWSDWAKLATVAPSRKCEVHVAELRVAAARYEEHPRLHDDLRTMTFAVFDAARVGLIAYQDWKRERRVVDYVDMLDSALTLVEEPRVRTELARRLRFVVVDEFQDTSPIQLALFVRLHALAGRSVWVGDRKQCIFEYAGADPVLMDAVAGWVERAGGLRDRLIYNYRSRPELVELCSELFGAALEPHGFERADVVATAKRASLPEHAALPPLGLWCLDTSNAKEDAEAVAEGVRRLLDKPHETPIFDSTTKTVRPLRPGDIAILAATNEWARTLASALHLRGLRAAIARAGLFDTPEGTLLDAALRWLLDRNDALAAAVIDALTGWNGLDPEGWLTERLRAVGAPAGLQAEEGEESSRWRTALAPLRELLAIVSPVEAVDGAIEALDLVRCCARWPDPTQRIANIDALRSVAEDYEDRCAQEREAATVAGLLRYFDDIRTPTVQRDELLPSDDQHVPGDEGAVVVCTYHKSKGLEWPVVILANLDRAERRDAFEVAPETSTSAFDPEDPLANRSIRYWPWPLGATKNAPLGDRAERSAEGRAVSLRERKERVRLLYVGFTRARDHLILAARVTKGKAKTAWLDVLTDADGAALLSLPIGAEGPTTIRGTAVEIATRVLALGAELDPRDIVETQPRWFVRPLGADAAARPPPYRITPSAEVSDWPEHAAMVAASRIGRVERLGRGITIEKATKDYESLGQAVHGFLAADVPGLGDDERRDRAKRLLAGWGMTEHLRAESVLAAGATLTDWATRNWPTAKWHREIPLEGPVQTPDGERWLSGIIDLLLELEEGYVLVDHKSFPAPQESAWRAKCTTFIPQLAAYALLLATTGKPVLSVWIHLPVAGGAVELLCGANRMLNGKLASLGDGAR